MLYLDFTDNLKDQSMKKILFLVTIMVLAIGAFIISTNALPFSTMSAKAPNLKKPAAECSIPATVRAYYNSYNGSLCGYLLILEDGTPLSPNTFPAKFKPRDGERVLIDYTIIEEVAFLSECDPGLGPVMGVFLNCIQEVRGRK